MDYNKTTRAYFAKFSSKSLSAISLAENQKGTIAVEDVPLRTRRALLLLKMFHWEPEGHYCCWRCSIENQKGTIAVEDVPLRTRRALLLLKMFHWEPEGHYCHSRCSVANQKGTIAIQDVPLRTRRALLLLKMFHWEPEGHYLLLKMFHWEPEGHYCHSRCSVANQKRLFCPTLFTYCIIYLLNFFLIFSFLYFLYFFGELRQGTRVGWVSVRSYKARRHTMRFSD